MRLFGRHISIVDPKLRANLPRYAFQASVATLALAVVLGLEEASAPGDTRCLARPDRRYATADDVTEFLRSLAVALRLGA